MKEKRTVKQSPAFIKKATFAQSNVQKRTASGENPDQTESRIIGWNFRLMDSEGRWACTFKKLTRYRGKLLSYEGQTIAQVLNYRHCHPVSCDAVCQAAQNRLKALGLDGNLAQLDLGTPVRLWGILHHNIFHLLWVDPDHSVYPSGK